MHFQETLVHVCLTLFKLAQDLNKPKKKIDLISILV